MKDKISFSPPPYSPLPHLVIFLAQAAHVISSSLLVTTRFLLLLPTLLLCTPDYKHKK
jgi:hypothetical protein